MNLAPKQPFYEENKNYFVTGKVLTRFVTTSLVVVVVVVVLQNIFGQSFITSPNTYATVYHLLTYHL